jgi:hypothetical protein
MKQKILAALQRLAEYESGWGTLYDLVNQTGEVEVHLTQDEVIALMNIINFIARNYQNNITGFQNITLASLRTKLSEARPFAQELDKLTKEPTAEDIVGEIYNKLREYYHD